MASKPITIRLIKTGSQPDWKIIYSTELQTIFYEYQNKNHTIKTQFWFGFNLKIFHLDIRGKLSIILCDKYILFNALSVDIEKNRNRKKYQSAVMWDKTVPLI